MPLSAPDPKPIAEADNAVPLPASDIRCPPGAPIAIDERDPKARDAGRFMAEDGAAIVEVEKAEFPAGPSFAKGRWRGSMLEEGPDGRARTNRACLHRDALGRRKYSGHQSSVKRQFTDGHVRVTRRTR